MDKLGAKVTQIATAFEMNVITWSEYLPKERAAKVGAKRVSKDILFRDSDFMTVHLVSSERSHHTVDAQFLI